MKNFYPNIEVNQSGMLQVSDIHQVYWEESGNPNGKPVIFVHGGPGGGTSPETRGFFNPEKYRIIQFDQRGCGKSLPHACLEENTTWDLIADMEKIREMLNIEKWQVFGGSWGSTLSLAYAEQHPERVTELVLRGIFLLRKKELQWFYQEGASKIFPDFWQDYVNFIPLEERNDLISAYQKRLLGDDEEVRLEAAKRWSIWEGATCHHNVDYTHIDESGDPYFALAFARIENHYFVNGGFFESENYVLENIDKIRHIPTVIVQGRYDVVCPMESAFELSQAFPEAKFVVADNSGHSAFEKEITHYLIEATDSFAN